MMAGALLMRGGAAGASVTVPQAGRPGTLRLTRAPPAGRRRQCGRAGGCGLRARREGGGEGDEGEGGRCAVSAFGERPSGKPLPTQGDALVAGLSGDDVVGTQTLDRKASGGDVDYLQELIAIQQSGPKAIGFFGTRNMGFLHQQMIEILSYAMVLTGNHIFTSGATGTNAAVIRGALRAENQDLLTVVLPQSLSRQPGESQELLLQVENVIEMRENDELVLMEASRICNRDILGRVQQVICFAFHDSSLLLETCREAKEMRKIVTLFYLD
eukprot:jgi/Tetstr1/443396/TSEL_031409.t1